MSYRALLAMELKLQLRQPAALALMAGLPLLLGPGALMAGETWTSSTDQATHGTPDDPTVLRIAASDRFASWVEPSDHLEVVPSGRINDDGVLEDDEVWVELVDEGRHFTATRDPQLTQARQARQRIQAVLRRRAEVELHETLEAAGMSPEDDLWTIDTHAVDADTTASGRDLGKLFPPLLMFTLLLGAVYTAFDVITGDKERRTSETLLTTGAARAAVLAAKATVVAGSAVVAGTAWVLGVFGSHQLGLLDTSPALQQTLTALSPSTLVLIEGLVLLLGLQVAGAAIGVASWVDDYRSGSMVAGPALLLLLAPSGLPLIDSLELTWWVALIPVGNLAMAFREVLAGQLSAAAGVGVIGIALAQALGAFALGRHLLAREETFTGTADADGRRSMGRFGPDAALTFVVVMVVFWFLGTLAQKASLVGGHLLTQASFAALGVAAIGFFGAPWSRLRLVRPRGIDAALAVVSGVCTAAVASSIFLLQEEVLPGGMRFAGAFAEALGTVGDSLPLLLFLFAVLPGICEELLFRGSLLGLLERDLPPLPRVAVVAAAFAIMHLSVYRLVPTFFVGCVAGIVVLRSRSLWCGILLHLTHNAVSVAGAQLGEAEPGPWSAADLLPGAVLAVVLGIAVALVGRGRSE